MKSTILLIAVLLSSLSFVKAQEFNFGVQVGLVGAKAIEYLNPEPDNYEYAGSMMASFGLNGIIGYKSNGAFGISLEPGFIQKGVSFKFNEDVSRQNYNYIHMPMLAEIYFLKRFHFCIGPELAYMLSAKVKGGSENYAEHFSNRFELSGIIGLSYELMDKIEIGIRYNHGITPILELEFTDIHGIYQSELSMYNQYFQLTLQYEF